MSTMEQTPQNRRDFLKLGIAATGITAAMQLSGCATAVRGKGEAKPLFQAPPLGTVRVGYVGVGHQGTSHVHNLLKIENCEITAICDIDESKVARAQEICVKAGKPKPDGYSQGNFDFKRMCERDDIDLVYTATPWEWHVPVCIAAMESGKHAATEVPAAVTIDECWQLVETAEKTGRHCVMMENCCYDRVELMILHMVRKGLLGELIHATCGYLHDLRELKLSRDFYKSMWRLKHSIERDGDLYPTHGLGPVAQCMNINRGNQFDYLVSTSTASKGLNLYAKELYGPDDPLTKQRYALGDVQTTIIKTMLNQTIVITHDTNSPRPYSRDLLVQGTKGVVQKYPNPLIYVEGISPAHTWEELSKYTDEWQHPLWSTMEEKSRGAGHGGMDFIEDYRLIECLRTGMPMDMDVYDAAAWSAISQLSERSIAQRGKAIACPDFTRGQWRSTAPLGIVSA